MKPLRTAHYDIEGNSFFRVFRFNVLNKLIPIGNYKTGTGMKAGLVLLCLHWFGKPLFKVLVRFEPYLHKIYLKLGRKG